MGRTVAYGEGRDLLISATIDVVAEKGLRGLTFRAIAERANVNNSLIAHHFGTREALIAAALASAVEQSIETTRLLDFASENDFAAALLDALATRPELQAFQYEMILEARRNPLYRAPVERLYARYQEVVTQSLQVYGYKDDPAPLARATFAALDGIVLQYMAGVAPAELRTALTEAWTLVRTHLTHTARASSLPA